MNSLKDQRIGLTSAKWSSLKYGAFISNTGYQAVMFTPGTKFKSFRKTITIVSLILNHHWA